MQSVSIKITATSVIIKCNKWADYAGAQSVIVWLGKESPSLQYVFKTIHRRTTFQLSTLGIEGDPKFWSNVITLLDNEYWSRLWIIQEVLLATKIELACGRRTLSWKVLDSLLRMAINDRVCPSNSIRDRISTTAAIWLLETRSLGGGPVALNSMPLGKLLSVSKTKNRSQIYDRLFGLLSLAVRGDCFPIDYRNSKWELFHQVLHLFWDMAVVSSHGTLRTHYSLT
jgi:hypothetical protein